MAERDPFDLLPGFVDPEPDPAIMIATIAQSREAFLRRGGTGKRRSLWTRLRQSSGWRLPAGAGVLALVAAIVVAPNLAPRAPVAPTDAPTVADGPVVVSPDQPTPQAPAIATGPEQAAPGGGTRMGMQPAPAHSSGSGSMPARESSSIFDGSNVRVEVRQTASMLEIYLPEIAPTAPIDSQVLLSGEEASVVGAFQIEDREIVAIQLDLDGTLVWRAYRPVDGAYTRDSALSDRVADAPDEAEARARLATQ